MSEGTPAENQDEKQKNNMLEKYGLGHREQKEHKPEYQIDQALQLTPRLSDPKPEITT